MPYLLIFGEEIVALSVAMTDIWVIKRIRKQARTRSNLQQKNINTNFIACELSVKRVDTFGVVTSG